VDSIVGLAFVSIDQCEVGSKFEVRTDNNVMVNARVVKLPFYDADGKRQEL